MTPKRSVHRKSHPSRPGAPPLAALLVTTLLAACATDAGSPTSPGDVSGLGVSADAASGAALVINEVMADPSRVSDTDGEWFELHNWGDAAADIQGWTVESGNDGPHTIASSLNVPAGGYVLLARNGNSKKNGGVTADYTYGSALQLANAGDWLALRDGSGATVDSVAWASSTAGVARGVRDPSADDTDVGGSNWTDQTSTFGGGKPNGRDTGTPRAQNDGYVAPTPPGGSVPATVVVSPAAASADAGASQQFTAQAYDDGGAPVATTFTWSSSDAGVATVDGSGLASAVAPGSAQIRATADNGVFGEASLTVNDTTTSPPPSSAPLTVKVLDIGQGDATYIENGGSVVLIDGGPSTVDFGAHLDALGLNGDTVDVVILSHAHYDHYNGLRDLFESARGITVRYFFENGDASSASTLAELRDSVDARVSRGETVYRDTDDPCGDGSDVCTITLRGGALLHVMKPNPGGSTPNNRSAPVKLIGPDSASFTMWFAGDAEHEAIGWFDTGASYDTYPGMDVDVLKGDHHGSCNGVTSRYLDLVSPDWVTFSVSTDNSYGHVHGQTKDLLNSRGIPWYRTDENGSITFETPGTAGGGYTVSVEAGGASRDGGADRYSTSSECTSL